MAAVHWKGREFWQRRPLAGMLRAVLGAASCPSAVRGELRSGDVARANFAPRFWGDVTTEPWGIKEITITHEQLTIDLRALVRGDPARVEVNYDLANSGASRRLELLFVSGEVGITRFEARLDAAQ